MVEGAVSSPVAAVPAVGGVVETIGSILGIVLSDLVLSGDNAVVIGIAAGRLSPERPRRAIIIGGAGAIGLRVFGTAIAAFLFELPYIELVGGLLLLWIAWMPV